MNTLQKILFVGFLTTSPVAFCATGDVDLSEVRKQVEQQDSYVRDIRKHFHLYPELSGQEVETAKYLKAELKKLGGISIHDVPGSTGFYAILDTGHEGKTVGLRTDIDGLPIEESTTNGEGKPKKWVSQNKGVTQGCGHDGHMAILLGTVRILSNLRNQLKGKVVFIFEEGEESNSGIRPMIAALQADGVKFDVIYGNHVASNVPSGQLFVKEGPIMAGMATLAYNIVGRGGHVSRPDKSINPVFAAANVLTSISIAWNNQRDLEKLVTLGVTQLEGGQVYNVIPNSVFIGGSLRFFDREAGEHALQLVKQVSESVAAAHGCTVSYTDRMKVDLPPVSNDTTYTRHAQQELEALYPGHVTTDPQYVWYGSETFSLYSQLAPTVFTLVGVNNPEVGSTAQHHNDKFDLDEDALQYGVGAMTQFTVSLLR
jgi:amidohydrolase